MKAKVIFLLMILSSILLVLCFFPKENLLNYKAQYIEGVKSKGKAREKYAQRAMKLNPIYPHTHLLLASVYLEKSSHDPEAFRKAMKELDTAVLLGAYRGVISWEALRIYLNLWPFLTPDEKRKALRAGKFAIRTMNHRQIKEMIDIWKKFCRNFDFIFSILKERPYLLPNFASILYRNHFPLKWRWTSLSYYERWILNKISLLEPENLNQTKIEEAIKQLEKIKFYYRLCGEKFPMAAYKKIKEKLLYYGAIKSFKPNLIIKFIKFSSSRDLLEELRRLLNENGLLMKRDFTTLYIKELLRYKLKEYALLKDEIEEFRASTKWVKDEEIDDYIKINLLLADVYYEENLLLRESDLLKELLKLKQTPEILLRLKRVREMTGENFTSNITGFYYKSPVLLNLNNKFSFLYSPPVGERSLTLDIFTHQKGKLIQIFMDKAICWEGYSLKGLQEVNIPLPSDRDAFRMEIYIK